jgi:putative sigma-54 modulation protein
MIDNPNDIRRKSAMERIITARHFHLREQGKEEVTDRLVELESEFRRLTSARVILDKQKNGFVAEVVLHGKNISIEAKGTGKEPLIAFDQAFDRVHRQVKKHYDKVKRHTATPISQLECVMEEIHMDEQALLDTVQ